MSNTHKTIVSPQQYDFINIDDIKTVTIIGAKGSGKSYAGPPFIANCVVDMPGSRGIFACSTNQQTIDIYLQYIEPIFKDLNWGHDWNQTKNIVTFWNGSTLALRSAESPDRIESIQYHWGWQDEVSLADWKFAKTFSSRIRAVRGTGHKRFTSMPDDPEHFIYTWLEGISDQFHEVSLYDNPDKEFVKQYEKHLKSIYHGNELKRLLQAARVSLTGQGLFAAEDTHKWEAEYDPWNDLYLLWDFNIDYRAVTTWQQTGWKGEIPVFNCIKSYQLKNYTTTDDAHQLCDELAGHGANIYLNGDASGNARSAQTSESMWKQVRDVFESRFYDQVYYQVPDSNPNVKDTIQVTNWALKEHVIGFSPEADIAWKYLISAKADRYGEIDKSRDSTPGAPRTHEVDTIRYHCYHIYESHFPGSMRKVAVLDDLKKVLSRPSEMIWN